MSRLEVLRRVAGGELTVERALPMLRGEAVAELGEHARLDLDRVDRVGIPEVVLASTKSSEELVAICEALLERRGSCCVSRLSARRRGAVEALADRRGAAVVGYGRRALRLVAEPAASSAPPAGLVGLLAAGTGDLEALAEAEMVCAAAGVATETVADVGVAGLHRLFAPLARLLAADVDALVVAAGMDGALPSVVAGLAGVPVVGLPTATGYGVGGRGRAALQTMLQSCAPGLSVVNIGNGVGAGAVAALVAQRRHRSDPG